MLSNEPKSPFRDFVGQADVLTWKMSLHGSRPRFALLSRATFGTVVAVSFAALLWGCAAGRLEERQMTLQTDYKQLSDDLNDTRTRLADTRASMADLQRQVNTLKGMLEERTGGGQGLGSDSYGALNARITTLEEEVKSQAALLEVREEELRLLRDAVLIPGKGTQNTKALKQLEASRSVPPPAKAEATDKEVPGEADETAAVRQEYEDAWKLLQNKDYRGAIAQFKRFLRKNPTSAFADNAQYWIGESYYALKEFDQAILEFDVVRRQYPDGDKVPAALLKQGYAFAELGDRVDARLILQEVIDRYPQSQEAQKARNKVISLGS